MVFYNPYKVLFVLSEFVEHLLMTRHVVGDQTNIPDYTHRTAVSNGSFKSITTEPSLFYQKLSGGVFQDRIVQTTMALPQNPFDVDSVSQSGWTDLKDTQQQTYKDQRSQIEDYAEQIAENKACISSMAFADGALITLKSRSNSVSTPSSEQHMSSDEKHTPPRTSRLSQVFTPKKASATKSVYDDPMYEKFVLRDGKLVPWHGNRPKTEYNTGYHDFSRIEQDLAHTGMIESASSSIRTFRRPYLTHKGGYQEVSSPETPTKPKRVRSVKSSEVPQAVSPRRSERLSKRRRFSAPSKTKSEYITQSMNNIPEMVISEDTCSEISKRTPTPIGSPEHSWTAMDAYHWTPTYHKDYDLTENDIIMYDSNNIDGGFHFPGKPSPKHMADIPNELCPQYLVPLTPSKNQSTQNIRINKSADTFIDHPPQVSAQYFNSFDSLDDQINTFFDYDKFLQECAVTPIWMHATTPDMSPVDAVIDPRLRSVGSISNNLRAPPAATA